MLYIRMEELACHAGVNRSRIADLINADLINVVSFAFTGNFDPQSLRTFPPAFLASLRERRPIVLPIAGDARKQAGIGGDAFGPFEAHSAPVDQADLADS